MVTSPAVDNIKNDTLSKHSVSNIKTKPCTRASHGTRWHKYRKTHKQNGNTEYCDDKLRHSPDDKSIQSFLKGLCCIVLAAYA